ncbi:MAG: glycosyltransferase family 4 protein [Anaerolineae bacterium]|nr:glycosyltransferase family 4 protein [Anaerolineae bacterium]
MARILHQFLAGALPGDAITDQALLLRKWLRAWQFSSDIFAEHVDPSLSGEVQQALAYRPQRGESLCIYHHSIGSTLVERFIASNRRLLLIYHNVTPPHFLMAVDPPLAQRATAGRRQLEQLLPLSDLALADSPYNERELALAGFGRTGVLPIMLDESQYQGITDSEIISRHAQQAPLLLFVGRLAPNKRQEDLVKLLFYVRRLHPNAHLVLVGENWMPAYTAWLRDFVGQVGLTQAVTLTGRVSQEKMVSYYHRADFYVSMSEHEGFGKPLLESMHLGLPVLAYAAAAVPSTLGDAGILFHKKDYPVIAELIDLLLRRPDLRQRLVVKGRERATAFSPEQVSEHFRMYLEAAGVALKRGE